MRTPKTYLFQPTAVVLALPKRLHNAFCRRAEENKLKYGLADASAVAEAEQFVVAEAERERRKKINLAQQMRMFP